MLNLEILNR